MKRIILIIVLILPLISCEDYLTEYPKDRLSEVNFYRTLEEGKSAVYAIYNPIRFNFGNGETCLKEREICADYAYGRGSTMPIGGEYIGLDATNIAKVEVIWAYFYKAINYANIAIEKISGINANELDRNALVAEARFLRAFCYFYLVRNWGPVPLRIDTRGEDIGRTPVNEVYNTIISDLQAGENDLPSAPHEYGRPTKWAAKALLAEVYLTIKNWELAKEKADEIVKSGKFSLVNVNIPDDFDKIFGASANGTSEEIFYLKYNYQNGTAWTRFGLWKDDTFTRGLGGYVYYSNPNNPFMLGWDDNDLRKQFDVFTKYISRTTGQLTQLPSTTPMLFSKFRDREALTYNFANDYPYLRYADVLLIYAEAASQANNGPTLEAVECLNKIRRRAYGYLSDSPSPVDYPSNGWTNDSFIDTVLQERAYEFLCEGKRWLDLLRTGTVEEVILAHKGKVVSAKHLLWPIPKDEINTNPLIKQADQNPGY